MVLQHFSIHFIRQEEDTIRCIGLLVEVRRKVQSGVLSNGKELCGVGDKMLDLRFSQQSL
jgi:hypothetical protein